jgi:hypothetical protein
MSHKCIVPELPEHGRFDQCSLCGQWYVWHDSCRSQIRMGRHRRPRWWAETVLSHTVLSLRERKSVRLNRRDDKKIARHQASKEATT